MAGVQRDLQRSVAAVLETYRSTSDKPNGRKRAAVPSSRAQISVGQPRAASTLPGPHPALSRRES
jgi:hypothetical protein